MMNNEEIERKMNFIVEQQAQFAVDIQLLQESQKQTEQVVTRTVDAVARTVDVVARTTETVDRLGHHITHVADAMREHSSEVDAKINALVDAQIRSEESLKNFIEEVDRRFREDENGK